ncbi:MAG: hypothetical protein AAF610_07880 [Pseudomonadota bacterium]
MISRWLPAAILIMACLPGRAALAKEPGEPTVNNVTPAGSTEDGDASSVPTTASVSDSGSESLGSEFAVAATDQIDDSVTATPSSLQLDTTEVSGNRERPKVLVIVPWKNPELVELTGRPLSSLVDEALAPIDPDVFRREVDFYNDLHEQDN